MNMLIVLMRFWKKMKFPHFKLLKIFFMLKQKLIIINTIMKVLIQRVT